MGNLTHLNLPGIYIGGVCITESLGSKSDVVVVKRNWFCQNVIVIFIYGGKLRYVPIIIIQILNAIIIYMQFIHTKVVIDVIVILYANVNFEFKHQATNIQ